MALAEGLRLLGEGTPRDQVMARRLVEVEDAGQAADRTSAQKKVFNRTFTRDDIMGLSVKEREKYKAKQSKLQSAMSTFHTQRKKRTGGVVPVGAIPVIATAEPQQNRGLQDLL